MELLYSLKDDQYPDNGYTHERTIVRAIAYNDDYKVALIHLKGDDLFGHRDYFETPGGGVKENEDFISALKRELKEEIGAEIDNIEEIGRVDDFYNLIYRKNLNHYYLCHVTTLTKPKLEDYETKVFSGIKWFDIDKAIEVEEKTIKTPLSTLVINRELPILKIAKKKIDIYKN